MVTGVLIGVMLVTMAPLLNWVVRERRSADERQAAVQEVANVMERVMQQNWDAVTPESAGAIAVSAETAQLLDGALLEVDVISSGAEQKPPSKRVAIELRWKDRVGTFLPPVRLTAWKYRQKESN